MLSNFFLLLAVLVAVLVAVPIAPTVIALVTPTLFCCLLYNYCRAMTVVLLEKGRRTDGVQVLAPYRRTVALVAHPIDSESPADRPADNSQAGKPDTYSEPAYTAYFFGQAFVDWRAVLKETLLADQILLDRAGKLSNELLEAVDYWAETTGRLSGGFRVALMVIMLSDLLSIISATVVGAVISVLLAGLYLMILLMFAAVLGLVSITFRIAEPLLLGARQIYMTCPHPGCFRPIRFRLPEYQCPNLSCRRVHRKLVPGRYGVFRRICGCGTAIPTSLLLGRGRIPALCPHCNESLPAMIGSAKASHLPFVGGTSAGKTMLLTAQLETLKTLCAGGQLKFSFATKYDERRFDETARRLYQGLEPLPTQDLRQAYLVWLGPPRGRRRLLYLYDAPGENYQDEDLLVQQGFLSHSEGVVFVVDPFSIASLRRSLDPADQAVAVDSHPSDEDPEDTYNRLSSGMRALKQKKSLQIPVVVTVTKADALGRLNSVTVPRASAGSAEIRMWLTELGLAGMLRNLALDASETQFALVSAFRAVEMSSTNSGESDVLEPLLWLLDCLDLHLDVHARREDVA